MQDGIEAGGGHVLWLAPDERQWLAQTLTVSYESALDNMEAQASPATDGARRFRATLLALFLTDTTEELPLVVSAPELWALDRHLLHYDLRDAKLPSGRLLMDFARKLWNLIAEAYRDELPPPFEKGIADGREDIDPNEGADAVAEAEALLRPAEDAGTG